MDFAFKIVGLFIIGYLAYFYHWKDPLSWLSYRRVLERRSLKAKESNEDTSTFENAHYYTNDYLKVRRPFLAMKVGYKPTDKKLENAYKT